MKFPGSFLFRIIPSRAHAPSHGLWACMRKRHTRTRAHNRSTHTISSEHATSAQIDRTGVDVACDAATPPRRQLPIKSLVARSRPASRASTTREMLRVHGFLCAAHRIACKTAREAATRPVCARALSNVQWMETGACLNEYYNCPGTLHFI